MKKVACLILILLFLTSCNVSTKMTFSQKNPVSGSLKTQIEVSEFFSDLLEDLSSFRRSTDKSLMQLGIDEFSQSVENTSVSSDVSTHASEEQGLYELDFDFSDFNALINRLSMYRKQNVLTVDDNSLELNINIDNYHYLKEMIPFLALEDIEVYGPEYNRDYSEDDYLTMMTFIAGEKAAEGIKSSVIKIQLSLPSDITETNGRIIDNKTVAFEFELIDFLLLHKPIEFYCKF